MPSCRPLRCHATWRAYRSEQHLLVMSGMHRCTCPETRRPQLLLVGNVTVDLVDGKRALVREAMQPNLPMHP